MVGMQAVTPPGVVAEDRRGPDGSDDPAHRTAFLDPVRQLAIDSVEKDDPIDVALPAAEQFVGLCPGAAVDHGGSCQRLGPSFGDQLIQLPVRVPRSLGPVRQHQVMHQAAGFGPFGQGGATPELDVVGVGADGQGALGNRNVGRQHSVDG